MKNTESLGSFYPFLTFYPSLLAEPQYTIQPARPKNILIVGIIYHASHHGYDERLFSLQHGGSRTASSNRQWLVR